MLYVYTVCVYSMCIHLYIFKKCFHMCVRLYVCTYVCLCVCMNVVSTVWCVHPAAMNTSLANKGMSVLLTAVSIGCSSSVQYAVSFKAAPDLSQSSLDVAPCYVLPKRTTVQGAGSTTSSTSTTASPVSPSFVQLNCNISSIALKAFTKSGGSSSIGAAVELYILWRPSFQSSTTKGSVTGVNTPPLYKYKMLDIAKSIPMFLYNSSKGLSKLPIKSECSLNAGIKELPTACTLLGGCSICNGDFSCFNHSCYSTKGAPTSAPTAPSTSTSTATSYGQFASFYPSVYRYPTCNATCFSNHYSGLTRDPNKPFSPDAQPCCTTDAMDCLGVCNGPATVAAAPDSYSRYTVTQICCQDEKLVDCKGVCQGKAEFDACGVCGGNDYIGSSCANR